MMQHNPLVQEIMSSMKRESMFRNLSKDELLSAVGDLISQELYKRTNTQLPKSLIDSIKNLIRQFFNLINSVKISRINKNVGIIADNILLQNQSLITQSTFKPGEVGKQVSRVSLEEALKKDKFAESIVNRLSEYFILTGSVTLAEQGTIFRPDENQVHDLDWVSPVSRETAMFIFEKLYPNNKYIRNISNEDYVTDTWIIVPEGYTIENLNIDTSKKVFKNGVETGSTNKVMSYDIVDSKGNVVSTYDGKTDSHTNNEIVGKAIDIFSYPSDIKSNTKNREIALSSGLKLKIADWRNTFNAKLLTATEKQSYQCILDNIEPEDPIKRIYISKKPNTDNKSYNADLLFKDGSKKRIQIKNVL
jgi:hypothetical protein